MGYDQTLVQIRERSHLELLDLALMVVRQRPLILGLAAAGGIAPFAVLNGWLLSGLEPASASGYWPLLLFFEAPWATAPLTVVLGGLMFGQAPRFGSVVRRLVVTLPSLIFLHVIVRTLLGITVLLIPLIPGRLWFASEVILLEKTGGLKALGRLARLSAGRSGEFFAQWIGQLFFGITFAFCFWYGTTEAISLLVKTDSTWNGPEPDHLASAGNQVGAWIAIAFFAVARFLIYIDQRIRSEGWEVRLRLQAAGRDLEGGER